MPKSFQPRRISANFTLCMIVARLMTALSLAGLLFPLETYPNDDLRQSFVANDVVNLVIGLPVFLGARMDFSTPPQVMISSIQ